MPHWEYLVVYIQDSKTAQEKPDIDVFVDADRFSEKLNIYGEAGWELVSFQWEENGAKAAMKRLKNVSQ